MTKLSDKDKALACKLKATGESCESIGKELSVNASTISRALTKPEQKALIEVETTKIINELPDLMADKFDDIAISKKLKKWLTNTNGIGSSNPCPINMMDEKLALELIKLGCKSRDDFIKSVGVLPSQSLSLFIQNIYSDNRQLQLDPQLLKLLGGVIDDPLTGAVKQDESDVVDAEYDVVDE